MILRDSQSLRVPLHSCALQTLFHYTFSPTPYCLPPSLGAPSYRDFDRSSTDGVSKVLYFEHEPYVPKRKTIDWSVTHCNVEVETSTAMIEGIVMIESDGLSFPSNTRVGGEFNDETVCVGILVDPVGM